jgi:UDP-N-acetylglucosamine 1-carboxyvinyltransferase
VTATTSWPTASSPITCRTSSRPSSSQPAASSPPMPPISAVAVSRPAARPSIAGREQLGPVHRERRVGDAAEGSRRRAPTIHIGGPPHAVRHDDERGADRQRTRGAGGGRARRPSGRRGSGRAPPACRGDREQRDRSPRVLADVEQIGVLEEARRGDERVPGDRHDAEHDEAAAVEPGGPLDRVAARTGWSPGGVAGCRALMAATPRDEEHRNATRRHRDRRAGARARRRPAPSPLPSRACSRVRAANCGASPRRPPPRSGSRAPARAGGRRPAWPRAGERRGERAERGQDRCRPRHDDDHPFAADPVGEHRRGSAITMPARTTEPATPIPVLADAEVVGSERDRLGEHRVDERRAHRCRASRPSTRTWRSSSRSGGAHHGVPRDAHAGRTDRPGRGPSGHGRDGTTAARTTTTSMARPGRYSGWSRATARSCARRAAVVPERARCACSNSPSGPIARRRDRGGAAAGARRRRGRRASAEPCDRLTHEREHTGGPCSSPAPPSSHASDASSCAGPWGQVHVPGAKNSVLKLMAATLLTDGTFEITNVPDIADVTHHGATCSRRSASRIERPTGPTGCCSSDTGDLTPVAPYELVERIRASINVLGAAADPVRPGAHVHARRRRLRLPPDRHARRRPRGDGGDVQVRSRRHRGVRRPAARRRHHVRLPERREPPRTSLTAAVLADGHPVIDNAAREPEIGDLCRFLSRWAPRSRGSAPRQLVVTGSSGARCVRVATHRCPTGSRRPPTSPPSPWPAARSPRRRARRPHGDGARPGRRHGHGAVESRRTTGDHVPAPERLRAIDVATLPYPGIATDYKPLIITMLAWPTGWASSPRTSTPVGSATSRSSSASAPTSAPTGTTPCAGRAAPVGRAGAGPRHPGRRRDGGGRVGRRGRHHDHRRAPHRPRLRRPGRRLAAVGADIERVSAS